MSIWVICSTRVAKTTGVVKISKTMGIKMQDRTGLQGGRRGVLLPLSKSKVRMCTMRR